jgi:hypothetical protein
MPTEYYIYEVLEIHHIDALGIGESFRKANSK